MLTKKQKEEQIKKGAEAIKQSRSLLFADFTGVSNGNLRQLRVLLRETGSKFGVIKKRLLKIAFKEAGVDYDPTQFESQAGVIFSPKETLEIAGGIYKFAKELAKKDQNFVILGGLNLEEKKLITAEEFAVLAKLPSRETLLAQLAMVLTMPIKQLAFVLNGRREKLGTQ